MIEIKRRPKIKRIPVKLSTELTRLFDIFAKPVDSSGFFGTKYSAGTKIIEITAKEMKSPLASKFSDGRRHKRQHHRRNKARNNKG